MTVLVRPDDFIPVQIDDMTFYFKVLSLADKQALQKNLLELSNLEKDNISNNVEKYLDATLDIVSKTLRKVEGIKTSDGKVWVPKFNEDKSMAKQSIEELLYLPQANTLMTVAGYSLQATLQEGQDIFDANGKKLEGVTVKKTVSRC